MSLNNLILITCRTINQGVALEGGKNTKENVSAAGICAFDSEEFKKNMGDQIEYTSDRYEALVDAEGLILITEWSEFRMINYTIIKKLMKEQVVFDGRNIYDPDEMKENGITYYGIGRKN